MSSFIQAILSLALYSSSGNSWSLTQAWNRDAAIVHFYPSWKSSSGNLGPNVSILSQAEWKPTSNKNKRWKTTSTINKMEDEPIYDLKKLNERRSNQPKWS